MEELNTRGILREAQEKKSESNLRRRKRKDLLRLQLIRVIEVGLFRGLLELGNFIDFNHSTILSIMLIDFMDSMRYHLEMDLVEILIFFILKYIFRTVRLVC